ncbi:50S ribosomal protein L24 [Candidatus Woesearchaeota archaeon]|jgi:large subunit ribosomal protein L24|nr:50S ribosomal protein L24 [Candidatus Woesearchaeota archaeon]MBT7062971.1 50S ribosomal protein L24 [Candidatus Woesearchaeota archaeon]MBT7402788.1 50S ribosomal protein L24 [Candidatus Woesearchaeota archaeon]
MRTKLSLSWLRSKQPRKQRKYIANAPLHKRRKMMAIHLNKEMIKKYTRRSFPAKTGDRVKILRGQFNGIIGVIEKVDLKKYRLHIKGAEHKKSEGRTSFYPIHPSNVIAIDLKLDDAKRKQAIEKKTEKKVVKGAKK